MFLEIGATILGLIQGVLVMFNKRSNWIFYILQMAFLILFSSIYLVMGFVGFILWNRNSDTNKITATSKKEKLIYILLIIVGTLGVSTILKNTNDPLPMLDAFTTITSLIATYYMVKKKIDTWVIWFINDIFYAIEYFILPNQAFYLFLLNVVWTLMAVGSYSNWKKLMKEGK